MKSDSIFLIVVAAGVFLASLGYGLFPLTTLKSLYGIEVNNVNALNIYRGIMGLYIALSVFWVVGAFKNSLRLPALWSLTIFMTGIGVGRILSMSLDGIPDMIFINYLIVEIIGAFFGFRFIKSAVKKG
tara:strand:+ start:1608 stop:1994 length:387 start_codon:yes stop_codon:yes gene_type:complete